MELKDIFKKLTKQNRQFKKTGFEINPDVYWKLILILSAVITLVFFSLGAVLFFSVNNESVNNEDVNAVRLKTVNKERLEEVIEYFAKREKYSANIISLPSPVIDPSR